MNHILRSLGIWIFHRIGFLQFVRYSDPSTGVMGLLTDNMGGKARAERLESVIRNDSKAPK